MQTHNTQTLTRKQLLRDRATFMRHHPTASEALLFSAIRGKRLGVAFKRQVVVGSHVVDFLARKANVIVEVDGTSTMPSAPQLMPREKESSCGRGTRSSGCRLP